MAPRSLGSTFLPAFSHAPIRLASSRPDVPRLEWEAGHAARSHSVRGSSVFSMAVPAARDSWWPQRVHWTAWRLVDIGVHPRLPHLGQAQPCGWASSNRRRSHASSVENLAAHSGSVPSRPLSPRIRLADMLDVPVSPSSRLAIDARALTRGRDGNPATMRDVGGHSQGYDCVRADILTAEKRTHKQCSSLYGVLPALSLSAR